MTADPPPAGAVARLPKAELHVHLEGTLAAVWPGGGFAGFLDHFRTILDRLRGPQDYGGLAARYLASAPGHGIAHVEFYVSLGAAARRGHDPRAVLGAIAAAADAHRARVTTAVIVDAVRQFGPDEAARTLDAALQGLDLGIVAGFGMGGDERALPVAAFRRVYERARRAGLRTTVHAGEVGGADAVREALDELAPDRIAHGIAAAQDRALLRRLADARLPLDVCLTSNLATGAVATAAAHPLRALLDAGVRVTLGTDDPGVFATDLTREYELAARIAGLDAAALERLARDSLLASFRAAASA